MIVRCRSKYNSHKVTVDGIEFDSKKEARRFRELSLLERAGQITNLQRQVKFVLIPAQYEPDTVGTRGGIKRGKLLERECAYVADFVYEKPVHKQYENEKGYLVFADGWETVVEDVKGYKQSTAYAVFVIKRKLMLHIHGIKIKEV